MSEHDPHGPGGKPDAAAILAANEALRAEVRTLSAKLDLTSDKGERTRWAVYGVALFAVVLTLGYDVYRTEQVDDKASVLREYDLRNCAAFNEQRTATAETWGELQRLIATLLPNPRPDARAGITRLQAKVDEAFALRDCSKVPAGDPGVQP